MVVRQAGEVGFDLHDYVAVFGVVAGGYRLGVRLGARLRGRVEVVDDRLDRSGVGDYGLGHSSIPLVHGPEHLARDDLRETRDRVERAAQFMDELADRIAGAAAEVLGAPPIRRLVALRAPGAAAIAAEQIGRASCRERGCQYV